MNKLLVSLLAPLAPYKGIWILESVKFLLVKSGILGLESGIQDPLTKARN